MSSESAFVERRKHPRINITLDYRLIVNDQIFYVGKTRNASLCGLFLDNPSSEFYLPEGVKNVEVELYANGSPLLFRCEIVYITANKESVFPCGIGVVFNEYDQQTVVSIIELAKILEKESHYDVHAPFKKPGTTWKASRLAQALEAGETEEQRQ